MTLRETLNAQTEAWNSRALLRRLYREWFEEIGRRLATVPGDTVELGSGTGRLKEQHPFVVTTDVEPTPWADHVVDAERLPYADGSLANLVLIDVFHHLADPAGFLDEARRTLAPGGRVVILDPYCSPVSTLAYRAFHPERTDLSAPAFAPEAEIAADPLASNQAARRSSSSATAPSSAAAGRTCASSSAGAWRSSPTRCPAASSGGAWHRERRTGRWPRPSASSRRWRPCSPSVASSSSSAPSAKDPDAELPEGERRHPQEQEPVAEAADVRLPVRPRVVADGEVDDAKRKLPGAEEQIEVAERVEVAEVRASGCDPLVVVPVEYLRPAERVLDRLPDDQPEEHREHPVAEHVQEPHGAQLEVVDEA